MRRARTPLPIISAHHRADDDRVARLSAMKLRDYAAISLMGVY